MLEITGIGRDTVAGFFAEVGDLSEYNHSRQITKLAGLSLKENTSGKHKGRTRITWSKEIKSIVIPGIYDSSSQE